MSRLRIAMPSYYLPSGSKIGVGYQAHVLANGLVARGHEVTVFSDCGPSEGAAYETVKIPLEGSLRSFRFATKLRRVDFSDFDVIHAHGDDYWMWRRRASAHVRTMHGSCLAEAVRISGIKGRIRMTALGLSEELATLVADRTVAVSPATRRFMPWVRTVIPNGVDRSVFSPGGDREQVPTILFVGTYHNRKRGALLMKAFDDHILPAVPEAKLWMVCADAPRARSVEVLGRLTERELVDRYRRAWVFCLPSSYEGFGIPYAEAMACGLPVVAVPNDGSRYVLDEGRAGVLAEADEIGPALVRLLRDERERERLSAAGLERSKEFDLDSVIDRYIALYAEIAAAR